jgi:hypothetical protein
MKRLQLWSSSLPRPNVDSRFDPPRGLRLRGILLLLIGSACLVTLAFVNPWLGAMCAPALPVLALALNFRTFEDLVDFRKIYWLGLTFWGGLKVIGLFGSSRIMSHYGEGLTAYTFSMAVTALLPMAFRFDIRALLGTVQIALARIRSRAVFATLAWWTLVAILYYYTFVKMNDVDVLALAGSILLGLLLALDAMLVLFAFAKNINPAARLGSIVALLATVLLHLATGNNRTMVLLPICVMSLTSILAYTATRERRQSRLDLVYMLAMIPLVLTVMFVADIQKKAQTSLVELVYSPQELKQDIHLSLVESTYIESSEASEAYFSAMSRIANAPGRMWGYGFAQLLTIVAPHEFFVEKPDFDVSRVAYGWGVIDNPTYFEIFIEAWLDSGLLGVVAYHFCFLMIGSVALKLTLRTTGGAWGPCFSLACYIVSLPTVFYAIRGPIILFAWFCFLPFMINVGVLILKRMTTVAIKHPA